MASRCVIPIHSYVSLLFLLSSNQTLLSLINHARSHIPTIYPNPSKQIGISTNNAASAGNSVSLQDPVGLYINAFQASRFTLDNVQIGQIPGVVNWTRGTLPQGLRFTISIPSTHPGKTVSDIVDTVTGNSINFGAQFADAITMGVNAVTISNWPVAALEHCPCDKAVINTDAAEDGQKGHIPYKIHRTI